MEECFSPFPTNSSLHPERPLRFEVRFLPTHPRRYFLPLVPLMNSGTDRRLIDCVPCGVLLCSAEGTVTYGNRAVERLCEVSRSQLLGRPVWEVFGRSATASVAERYLQMLTTLNVEALPCSALVRTREGREERRTLIPVFLRGSAGRLETILCVLHHGLPSEEAVDLESDILIGLSKTHQLFILRGEDIAGGKGDDVPRDLDTWIHQAVAPEDRDELRRYVAVAIEDKSSARDRIVRALMQTQNETRAVWWRAIPLVNVEGRSEGTILIGRFASAIASITPSLPKTFSTAVSDELGGAYELRDLARVLETIFHTIPDAAWLKDRLGRFVVVNKAYADLYGLTPQDLVGKTCYDYLPVEEADKIAESDQEVIRSRNIVELEQHRTEPSGTDRTFETIKVPVIGDSGEALAIVGISREITDRRRYVRELEEYRNELRRQLVEYREELSREAARLKALCDAIPDLVVITDAQERIVRIHVGTQPHEWMAPHKEEGKCLCDVFPRPVVDVFRSGAAEARGSDGVVTKTWSLEIDGKRRFFRARFQTYLGDQIIAVVEDTTESVIREESIRKERERLARVQRISLAGGLATGIAHELNQPLTSLALYASTGKQIARQQGELDRDRLIDLFEKIDLLAVRCGEIVRNLRQFIRRRTTHVVTVSAHDLIQNALMLVQSSILTANLRVEITVSPDLHVRVDQVQIQQVLVNLIGNAIDAMEQRPPDERVLRLSVQRRGESIEFSVQDTGLGMNPGEAERVFDPFFTTKPQGIGMGLAICKSIVESHGGRIWVESQVGSGTTVYFRVPAEETSAERPVHNEDFGD